MTNALEKRRVSAITDILDQLKPKIQQALPAGMMADRMIRIAITTFHNNRTLLECSNRSIVATLIEACQLGLALDGALGHAYPVPFKNKGVYECQMMVGYKGFAWMAWQSAGVIMSADVVYSGDQLDYQRGTSPFLHHRPARGDRGEAVAAWAAAEFPDGRSKFEVLDRQEVEKIRDKSNAYRYAEQNRKDSPWHEWPDEMWKKTAIRRLAKSLPLSADLTRQATLDENRDFGIPGYSSDSVIDVASLDAEVATKLDQAALRQKITAGKGGKNAAQD